MKSFLYVFMVILFSHSFTKSLLHDHFPFQFSYSNSSSSFSIKEIKFNNSFVDYFSDDGNSFYSFISSFPKIVNPVIVNVNDDVANVLGISTNNHEDITEYFSGNKKMEGSNPIAMTYAGHQFGEFTPQLGDGRASLLGEIYKHNENWALHAKGTGPTPYSRGGDGRAVLRSSIREYLCGEALYFLGIPSTRALSIIGSTTPVRRETVETAAVVVRIAPVTAFVRFGTFELFSSRNQLYHIEKLANYVVSHNFPQIKNITNTVEKLSKLLFEISYRTGELIAKWMAVGFTHGVLNTDNMSIMSMTIDFGPFGFMDEYDPHFIPNHSDDEGRYAFDQQVEIGKWNLERLVDALNIVIRDNSLKKRVTDIYERSYESHYGSLMRAKLGLNKVMNEDENLWKELLSIMHMGRTDYTNFFRTLSIFSSQTNFSLLDACERNKMDDKVLTIKECKLYSMIGGTYKNRKKFSDWAQKYSNRLLQEGSNDALREISMNKVNPKYILRNYLAHIAIENAKQGDFYEVDKLLHLLQNPFDEQPEMEIYAAASPSWAKELEISCSS